MSFFENLTLLLVVIGGSAAAYLWVQAWWQQLDREQRKSTVATLTALLLVGGVLLQAGPYHGDPTKVPGGAHPSGDPFQKKLHKTLQP